MVLYECEAKNAAVMYTMTGFCKLSGVNIKEWLTHFLDHIHEYDTDYSLHIADFLLATLATKGLVKTSENLHNSLKKL